MKVIDRWKCWQCRKEGTKWQKKKPKHIGIIPDGNRRWAKQQVLEKQDGYAYGLQPGLDLFCQAKEYGIEELTFYGFTVDNCKRPAVQVQAFQKACVDAVHMITEKGADLLVIGNAQSKCFPPELIPYTKCVFGFLCN